MIHLAKVSKVFKAGRADGVTAVKEVSLSINGEGTVVFRGPSGSGKTTLLSLVGCMSRPTSGRIWINDTEVSSLSERFLADLRRQYFGFIFQGFQLVPGLSALTNVMLPLYPCAQCLRQLRSKAMRLLAELELDSKATQRVEHLSGGEQQRVALARALINDPEILVADEPTAHLDTALSHRFMDLVDHLKRQGKTVLMASHDPLVFDSPVTNRVVTLRDGCLQAEQEGP